MPNANLFYKLVALVSVSAAIYSCNSPADSQRGQSMPEQLQAIQEAIEQLRTEVAEIDTKIAASEGCSTEAFLANLCASGELPDDVGVSTTYCVSQGRGLELGATYAIEPGGEIELGGGWPNVVWAKVSPKVGVPIFAPTPLPIPLPTEFAGGGSTEIGQGLEICVDVPLEPTGSQRQLIGDLIRGVNIETGIQAKYHRRTNRLLNYAARRTPIAEAQINIPGALKIQASIAQSQEDSDDAFDIADEAVEQFMSNGFQPQARAIDVLNDPIFTSLAASLDLPASLADTIRDPQHVLDALQSVTPASACVRVGLDNTVRSRFPGVDGLCDRIEALPDDVQVRAMAERVTTTTSRVLNMFTTSGLRDFMCGNIALAVLAPDCP
ncbi:MAG TPA: hypothetical protein VKA43_13850 [Gammaproteobacteria bacterium]|nr:hypothetical protein [Gammaproteobacteria bacterium]